MGAPERKPLRLCLSDSYHKQISRASHRADKPLAVLSRGVVSQTGDEPRSPVRQIVIQCSSADRAPSSVTLPHSDEFQTVVPATLKYIRTSAASTREERGVAKPSGRCRATEKEGVKSHDGTRNRLYVAPPA